VPVCNLSVNPLAEKAEHVLMQEALTAFMEDIISHMAGYVPLKAIAERILASYASDPFGDFKVPPPFSCSELLIVRDCVAYSCITTVRPQPNLVSHPVCESCQESRCTAARL